MNSNFTRSLKQLEEYSLAMIDLFDNLPASFFEDPSLEPPQRVVDYILKEAKKDKNSQSDDTTSLYSYSVN